MLALAGARDAVVDRAGGDDWLDFAAVTSTTVVNLADGWFEFDDAGVGISGSIENVVSGDGADILIGSGDGNLLYSMRGNDLLFGRAGSDVLASGSERDFVSGGVGEDTASFETALSGVATTLAVGFGGDAAGDRLKKVENLLGSNFNDLLIGDDDTFRGNDIIGDSGNDFIIAGAGTDTVTGSAGNDLLVGGASKDYFRLTNNDDFDIVLDFDDGSDLLLFDSVAGADAFGDLTIARFDESALVVYDSGALLVVGLDHVGPGDFLFA
jgi:Ca2+-binding RTX toxin-like protein